MEQLSKEMTLDEFIFRLLYMTGKYDVKILVTFDADKKDYVLIECKDEKGSEVFKAIKYYYASDVMGIDILDEIEHRIRLTKDREYI